MARRDVDVVIGARTDRSAFAKTEQETKGFLSRLRGGSGGTNASALDTTSRTLEKLAKVTAVAVAVESASRFLETAFVAAEAHSAEVKGNLEQAAAKYAQVVQGLQSLPFGVGPLMQLIERVENLVTGNPVLSAELQENQRKNIENDAARGRAIRQQQIQLQRERELVNLIAGARRDRELESLVGHDRDAFLLAEQETKRMHELQRLGWHLRENETAQQAIQIEQTQTAIEFSEKLHAVERARLRTQQKIREQMERFIGIIKSTPRVSANPWAGDQPQADPFRPSLPSLLSGNLLTGSAAQSEQGAALRETTERVGAAAVRELTKVNATLGQLLQATRGQNYAPVLQNF